jgi:hypothetical protein
VAVRRVGFSFLAGRGGGKGGGGGSSSVAPLCASPAGAVLAAVAFFSLASSDSSVEPGLVAAEEGAEVWSVSWSSSPAA